MFSSFKFNYRAQRERQKSYSVMPVDFFFVARKFSRFHIINLDRLSHQGGREEGQAGQAGAEGDGHRPARTARFGRTVRNPFARPARAGGAGQVLRDVTGQATSAQGRTTSPLPSPRRSVLVRY